MENEEEYLSKAKEIVKQLSTKEKASLVYGRGAWHTGAISNRGINAVTLHDGPLGLRAVPESKNILLEGAPKATCFPAPCLTACSWDPSITSLVGGSEALEAIDQNTDVILAPGVNIKRNPLCGRNFEYLSEDPLLAGIMASGFIKGAESKGVMTSIKHYACNNQEFYRLSYSAEADDRALREIYLKPFEIAIKDAKPSTVMCSYNRLNGVYSSDNDWLLKDVLRDEWGFEGLVMSDWGATNGAVSSHECGLDLQMPCNEDLSNTIVDGVKKSLLSSSMLDECAAHVVAMSIKASKRPKRDGKYSYADGHKAALEAAIHSLVLLKNDDSILPLKDYSNTCLIGSLASSFRYQGAGSSQVTAANLVSFLDSYKKENGKGYKQGYPIKKNDGDSEGLADEAIALAKTSDNVILFLGLPPSYESEGFDRDSMKLPPEELSLFDEVYSVNKNVVVVLLCGAPIELPFASKAKAILLSYLPGEAGGEAINEIILGRKNPSGKLAETWPKSYEDVVSKDFYPGDKNHSLYKESIFVGYRYYLSAGIEPLFPFGYGLSYSRFVYSDLKVSSSKSGPKGFDVSFSIQNNSGIDGEETSEIYSSPVKLLNVFKPKRELRAFKKVLVKAHDKTEVSLFVPVSAFSHYDERDERFETERGDYYLEVGSSANDILLKEKVSIQGSDEQFDMRSVLPSYYSLEANKGLKVSDEEFIKLLGHPLSQTPKARPFTLNSTIGDISDTFIGKIINKVLDKKNPLSDPEAKEKSDEMMKEISLRMGIGNGLTSKQALAIVSFANRHFFQGIYRLMFGRLE